jgi:hypothetical protein
MTKRKCIVGTKVKITSKIACGGHLYGSKGKVTAINTSYAGVTIYTIKMNQNMGSWLLYREEFTRINKKRKMYQPISGPL